MVTSKKLEEYAKLLLKIITSSEIEDVNILFDRLKHHFYNKGRIFLSGNGGSASIANHAATDLSKLTHNNTSLNSISLNSNISLITAISNDDGYENVFSNIIKNHDVNSSDTLITISSSGNSRNLMNLIESVKETNIFIFSLLGFDGGEIAKISPNVLITKTPSGYYGPVEDVHMMFFHIFAHLIKEDLTEIT